MYYFTVFAIFILKWILTVSAEGQYTIIGPGTIHSARKYNVVVGVHHTTEPTQLKVGITGPLYNETKTVDLQPNKVKNIEFDVPKLEEEGSYNLTAEGVAGLIFKNTTGLNLNVFKAYTTVQTDKGTYKPGEWVNFRVVFLDENLKPYEPEHDAIIWLEDAKLNRIKEFKHLEVVKGVYTSKFQLSEFPVLGYWRLVVKNGGRYPSYAHFEVSKYVLPKYEVKVEATESVSVRDGNMQVVVRANYTYGKPVDAKVTLVISMNSYYVTNEAGDFEEKTAPAIIKTAEMVNGKAKFDLNVKEYAAYMPDKNSPHYLAVTVTVEENFTDIKLNGTAGTLLYPYRYKMDCVSSSSCYTYDADEEKDVTVQVKYVDDTQVKDTKSLVKLTYKEVIDKIHRWRMDDDNSPEPTPPTIENKMFTFESHLNETGMAVFKVMLPELEDFKDFSHYFQVNMTYADEERNIVSTFQHRKPKDIDTSSQYKEPKKYLKLTAAYAENKYSVKLNEPTVLMVNSSAPLSYLIYNIIGRGNILHSERIEVPDNAKLLNITVTPTFLMSPHAKFYIYYVDENGEFHYANAALQIEFELQNQIEITAPEQVKPGEDVALRIKTAPNSFVGLLAVDQSVLLLSGGNNIEGREFQWRLSSFDTHTNWQGGYSPYPGDSSGVVTLTNADYFYNRTAPGPADVMPYGTRSAVHKAAHSPVHQLSADVSPTSGSFGGGAAANSIAVRKDFSETWIFADIVNTETEEFTWAQKIPDTITSWVISGFSLNPDKGLGVTDEKTKVKTYQPFFISIRLPYAVKRGEVINVPALVFNYLEKDLDVEVTLDNSDNEFDFTEVSNEVINEPKRSKTVRVPADSAAGVSFMLRPKVIGNIMLKYTAISPIAGDAIHKTLKVIPEGVTEYANRAYLVNLKDTSELKETFELALPSEVVPDSEHIEFTVIGDLLGPILNNLDHLVRMPTGCGEQVTSTLVPNYLVLRYLKSINKLTPALEFKIKHNLETGYQHILRYRLNDGSFSSFGPPTDGSKPHNGSTWLTAYAVRSLQQAGEHIKVDEEILKKGIKYLASKQAENGSFVESHDFFYASHRHHVTLTAKVLLAFIDSKVFTENSETTIDKALKYVLENIEKDEDLHVKALATYVLHRAKQPMAVNQLETLKVLAKTDDDRMWWSQTAEKPVHDHWWRWSFSNDVEITSYILLTLLDQEKETVETVLPILKWLIAQRNSYGGFSSTQDTVVGLQALIKFAEKSGYEAAVMDIDFTSKGGKEKQGTVKVNNENGLLLQSEELPQKTQGVGFHAKGTGAALVQISYQYNILEKEKKPSFSINTINNKESPPFKLELEVCVEYTGDGEATNMALVEISLPSGFVADVETFEHILAVEGVRQTETKNSDSVIVVYFESLRKNEVKCLPVEALKSFAVALQKPVPVVAYDYYDRSKKATAYYEVISKLCEICEDDQECKKACQ